MTTATERIIRLAYEKPALRKPLLMALWKTAKNFSEMGMMEIANAVRGKFPGSKYNRKQGMLELSDGRLVMFSRGGRGDASLTEVDIWKWADDAKRKVVPVKKKISIKSVEDAVSKIKSVTVRTARHLQIGDGFEDEQRGLRYHRYRDQLQVTDLTNAGKRGKKVNQFSITDLYHLRDQSEAVVEAVLKARTFNDAKKAAQAWADGIESPFARLYETTLRGVDVTPPGFKPITVEGKFVYITARFGSFTIKDLEDRHNEPTCIPAIKGGKKDIKVFYRWVKDNESKLKNMKFREVLRGMMSEGIKFHQYCAVD